MPPVNPSNEGSACRTLQSLHDDPPLSRLAEHLSQHDAGECSQSQGDGGFALPSDANRPVQRFDFPSVQVYLLSPFRVFVDDQPIDEWPNCKGRSIFKYMAIRRGQPVPREVLMAVFWPEADQDAARNNLNVAIHGLRKALARATSEFPFVLFRQGCYSFNSLLRIWVDAEAFERDIEQAQEADRLGETVNAVAHYRQAQATYHSALLVDDRYEDWLIPKRQSLQTSYRHVLSRLATHYLSQDDFEACAGTTRKMIEVDNCDEEAHRQLMRCYSRLGHTQLALRQYHFCVDALARELSTIPSPHTVALFHQLRRHEAA